MARQGYRFRRTRRRRSYVREQSVWPLPALNAHPPVIITVDQNTREATLAYGQSRLDGPSAASGGDGAVPHPFYMPEVTPVLAIKSGVVLGVCKRDGIYRVMIDHGNRFATNYDGLHEVVEPTDRKRLVKAGEVIGFIRSSASVPCALRFTLSRTDLIPGLPGFPQAVDPLDVLLATISIPIEETSTRKEAA